MLSRALQIRRRMVLSPYLEIKAGFVLSLRRAYAMCKIFVLGRESNMPKYLCMRSSLGVDDKSWSISFFENKTSLIDEMKYQREKCRSPVSDCLILPGMLATEETDEFVSCLQQSGINVFYANKSGLLKLSVSKCQA